MHIAFQLQFQYSIIVPYVASVSGSIFFYKRRVFNCEKYYITLWKNGRKTYIRQNEDTNIR